MSNSLPNHSSQTLTTSTQQLPGVLPRVRPHGLAHVDCHLSLFVLDALVASVLKEKVYDFHVPAHRGPVKRGVVPDVQGIDFRAVLD